MVVLVSFLLAYWLCFGYTALPQIYTVTLLLTLVLSSTIFPGTSAFRLEFVGLRAQVAALGCGLARILHEGGPENS